ncbi:unnamed protein product [Linum trigynum]|uniref:Uncharacterized protein n=1 Tax=Linum trigynum TaxID=586398 RepID=A0AAV2GNA7_9ROSI
MQDVIPSTTTQRDSKLESSSPRVDSTPSAIVADDSSSPPVTAASDIHSPAVQLPRHDDLICHPSTR